MEYIAELKNGLYFKVTEKVADIIDKTEGFVIIEGNRIDKNSIKGIWTKEVWEDLYPERRFIQPVEEVKRIEVEKTDRTDLWLEVIERNKKLLMKKQPPKWKLDKNNKIVIAEKGYFDKQPKKDITASWVKMRVSEKKLPYYLQSPGYKVVEKFDNGAFIAFTWPDTNGVPPNHIVKCNEMEAEKLNEKNSYQS